MNRREAIRGLIFAPALALATVKPVASAVVAADVLFVTIPRCTRSDERMKLSAAIAALRVDYVIVCGDVDRVKFEKFKGSAFDAREQGMM